MAANIGIILGSRDPRGRTATAARAVLHAVIGDGVQCDQTFLTERPLERCRQCDDDGWGPCRRDGVCVVDDALPALIERLRVANAMVFATPVYYSAPSESMQAFLDRLRRVCAHEGARADRLAGMPVVGVCVAGGGGGGATRCCVALEQVLLDCGFEVLDMVPVRRQNLHIKKHVLRTVGRWLASVATGA